MLILKIPTWATFYHIPLDAPDIGLAALNAALGTSLEKGDSNPVWADLQDLDLGGGPLTRGTTPESLAEVTPIANAQFITKDQMALAVAVGGDAEGAVLWLEIPSPTDEVPAAFPNRTYTDNSDPENPTEATHTYESYFAQGNWTYPKEIDGKYYIPNVNPSNRGQRLPYSIVLASGLTPMTKAEWDAIQPSPDV